METTILLALALALDLVLSLALALALENPNRSHFLNSLPIVDTMVLCDYRPALLLMATLPASVVRLVGLVRF